MRGFSDLIQRIRVYQVPLFLCAFFVFALGMFLKDSAPVQTSTDRSAEPLAFEQTGGVAGTVTPSRDNVDHSLLAREEQLLDAIRKSPADTTSRLELARFYHDAHRRAAAIDHYQAYLDQHPSNKQAWLDLADCLASTNRWEEAQAAMEELLRRLPDDPAAMYNLGAILANSGDVTGAAEWWRRTRDQKQDAALATRAAESLARLGVG